MIGVALMSSIAAIEIVLTLLLIIANGFFSGSEIAIVSARPSRLQQRINAGERGAQQALDLAQHSDRFLATVQVGITLISTLAAAFGGARISQVLADVLRAIPALASVADTLAFLLVVTIITYLSLVVGELVPKRMALQHAEAIAVRVAPIMAGLARWARPVIALLSASSNLVLRLLRQHRSDANPVTEEDILYLTNEATTSGGVEAEEAQLIRHVFRFTDRVVREVMTPRGEIVAVEVTTPASAVVAIFLDSGHSRVPVYEHTLDEIVGILHVKDLLRAREQQASGEDTLDLRQIARKPTFVLEHQHIADLLPRFQREGTHMALVTDEYGQIAGLLTLEDTLEELVGDISDEYDVAEAPSLVRRDDGTWLVDGAEAYESVREQIGLPPIPPEERGEYTSLAGVIIARLGRIPVEGDTVQIGAVILEVVDMDGRRVDKVLARPQPVADAPSE